MHIEGILEPFPCQEKCCGNRKLRKSQFYGFIVSSIKRPKQGVHPKIFIVNIKIHVQDTQEVKKNIGS